MKINVLGTEYTVLERATEQYKILSECDGYCDKTTKIIVIKGRTTDCDLGNFERYLRKVMRHEIIHAFLFESGLAENFERADKWGHDETTIDWFAIQYPKLTAAFKEAGCFED